MKVKIQKITYHGKPVVEINYVLVGIKYRKWTKVFAPQYSTFSMFKEGLLY
jgi:hypothetical protein